MWWLLDLSLSRTCEPPLSAGLLEVNMPRKQAMEQDRFFSPRFGRVHMVCAAWYGNILLGCERLDLRKSKYNSVSKDTSR